MGLCSVIIKVYRSHVTPLLFIQPRLRFSVSIISTHKITLDYFNDLLTATSTLRTELTL